MGEPKTILTTQDLAAVLKTLTAGHCFWERYLEDFSTAGPNAFAIHLAILVEPYLRFIMDGQKTVESRFSAKRIPPFNSVDEGDVVVLKRSSGPIVGICLVDSRWFYQLDPTTWDGIRKQFTEALCAEAPSFWEQRQNASYATLMRISHVHPTPSIAFEKKDRRGWIVLHPRAKQQKLMADSDRVPRRVEKRGHHDSFEGDR